MKRSLIGVAIAAAVLMILFAACSEPQIIAFERAEPVSNVEVSLDSGGSVNIFWKPAKNAVSYDVYSEFDSTYDGTKLSITRFLGSTIITDYLPSKANISGLYLDGTPGPVISPQRFGVVARDYDSNHATSVIVWSDYINIPDTSN